MRRALLMLCALLVTGPVALAAKRPTTPDARPAHVAVLQRAFSMGTPVQDPGGYGGAWKVNEWPQVEVTVGAFSLQQDEVTVGQWIEFLGKVGHLMAWHPLQPVDYLDGEFVAAGDPTEPIRAVTWEEADAFCRWHDGALPTEAQWERAAHGQQPPGGEYVWDSGGLTCAQANVASTYAPCAPGPRPVGSHSPAGDTDEGLRDMIGNVAEWVADVYAPYPGGPPAWQVGAGDVPSVSVAQPPCLSGFYCDDDQLCLPGVDGGGKACTTLCTVADPVECDEDETCHVYQEGSATGGCSSTGAESPERTPDAGGTEAYRVVRGGSWIQYGERSRRASRSYAPATSRSVGVGFRCAWEAGP